MDSPPSLNSLDMQLWNVFALFVELGQHRHEDQNKVITFMNDLQHNQWEILYRLASLRRSQRWVNDILDQIEAQIDHLEFHVHQDPKTFVVMDRH